MDYKQIVVYDVPQDHTRLRTKIIGVLEDFGLERFQYSVFGGNLSKEQVENLVVVLKRL
ncbi:MAG: CRISPR-associated endonuclease Cas2, partial [Candidatus Thorarchaeota archaeon]